jgi:hypothetical protein
MAAREIIAGAHRAQNPIQPPNERVQLLTEMVEQTALILERSIRNEILPEFPHLRIGLALLEPHRQGGKHMRYRYIVPNNAPSSRHPFAYPVSVAAWALIENRELIYPFAESDLVDFDWINTSGKWDAVEQWLSPELAEKLHARTLTLNDICQGPDKPMKFATGFICVPVPMRPKDKSTMDYPDRGTLIIDFPPSTPSVSLHQLFNKQDDDGGRDRLAMLWTVAHLLHTALEVHKALS